MNRLLFGDNLKWLRDTKVFPDANVVELVEALKKFLKTSPMMACLAMVVPLLFKLNWLRRLQFVKETLSCAT